MPEKKNQRYGECSLLLVSSSLMPCPASYCPPLLHSACPGRFIGMDIIWIVVVSLLATYNITKAIDENGH